MRAAVATANSCASAAGASRGASSQAPSTRIWALLMVFLAGGASLLFGVHRDQVALTQFTQRQITGLECIDQSAAVATAAAALMRPLTMAAQGHGTARVDAEVAALAATPSCYRLGLATDIEDLRREWAAANDMRLSQRASRLLSRVAGLTTAIGNHSGLVLDPVATTYHKADLIITVLPALRVAVAETARPVRTYGAAPSGRSHTLVAQAAQVELLTDQLELRAEYLFAVDPAAEDALSDHVTQIVRWGDRITPGHVLSAPLPDAQLAADAAGYIRHVNAISAYVRADMRAALEARLAAQQRRSQVSLSALVVLLGVGVGLAAMATRDAARRRKAEDELHHRAFHDALTGLANRDLFHQHLAAALTPVDGPTSSVAVVLIDLNDFKAVNDSFGHHVGDALLVEVASRLKRGARADDLVARLGGDEFALLLHGVDENAAEAVCARLLTLICSPCELEGHEILAYASLGIYVARAGEDAEQAIRNADIAMYDGKGHGVETSPILFDAQRHAHALERNNLSAGLPGAVARGELVAHYQPVYDLRTREITGTEALMRWQHPERGLLLPEQFIPLAEAGTSILEIGEWMLVEASRQTAEWRQFFGSSFQIGINLSVRQLMDPGASRRIANAIAQGGLAPEGVFLEVPEAVFTSSGDQPVRQLRHLRELGFSIAVDDFGTGYSSLGQLRVLPIDLFKIHGTFVAGVTRNEEDSALADAVIRLARSMGRQTLAEGIETEEQHAYLRTLGCDLGQGYLLADPLPADEATRFIAEARRSAARRSATPRRPEELLPHDVRRGLHARRPSSAL